MTTAQNPAPQKTEAERQADALAAVAAHRAKNEQAVQQPQPDITAQKPTKPEGVPDKFWNAETGTVDYKKWGEAHSSLETQFHQKKGEQKPNEQPPQGEQKPNEQPPADPRKAAIDSAQAEFAQTGKLSDASYAALEKAGYARDMVDTYIAGQSAKATSLAAAAHSVTEGAENYGKMTQWASENLSSEEIEAFNAQLATNNPAVIKVATQALFKRYQEHAPSEGNRVSGGAPPASGGMFQSKAEMTAAMSVPSETVKGKTKYETDPVYRAEVIRKINAARKARINIFV
jgi:hypothetical protein